MAVACPICGNFNLEKVLSNIDLQANDRGVRVGGVCAYRCIGGGHIFFLRVADLAETFRPKAVSVAASRL
jgi:hypothetical protein